MSRVLLALHLGYRERYWQYENKIIELQHHRFNAKARNPLL